MKNLFSEFDSPTLQQWLEKVKKDLKTDDIEKVLNKRVESLNLPISIQDSERTVFSGFNNKEFHHPEFAYANDWEIQVRVSTDDLLKANQFALKALNHGASSLCFTGIEISNQEELRLVLKGIQCDIVPVHFDCDEATPSMLFMYLDEVKRMNLKNQAIKGSLAYDPLGDLAFKGSFDYSFEESMQLTSSLVETSVKELPNYKVIHIKGARWHNAGATAAQELAVSFSLLAEYLINLKGKVELPLVLSKVQMQFASGSEYFLHLAKFRAARVLWNMILEAFDIEEEIPLWISSETSKRNKTIFDENSNLLRATTESMAAVIGGSDEHHVYTHKLHADIQDWDAQRLAINIHHLLKYEGQLDKVSDPSKGSTYIENLTKELIDQAWSVFLKIEEKGGYTAAIRSGFLQELVSNSRAEREGLIRSGKRSIVGINKFAKADEKAKKEPIHEKDVLAKLPEVKTLEPYVEASSFESLRRLFTLDKQPSICLIQYGDKTKSKMRADFSADFFASAGFSATRTDASVEPEDQVFSKNVQESEVLVLCSSDEEYEELLMKINSTGGVKQPIVIAGNPSNANDLKHYGVAEFIYMGCDAIKIFHNLLERIDA